MIQLILDFFFLYFYFYFRFSLSSASTSVGLSVLFHARKPNSHSWGVLAHCQLCNSQVITAEVIYLPSKSDSGALRGALVITWRKWIPLCATKLMQAYLPVIIKEFGFKVFRYKFQQHLWFVFLNCNFSAETLSIMKEKWIHSDFNFAIYQTRNQSEIK